MISEKSVLQLKESIDIVETISTFLELKKNGANFKACCPFHGEKKPSFVISPAKQIYHCFGCGVGGDSIKFVMEYEKLEYPEALEKLADLNNINLEYENKAGSKFDTKVLDMVLSFNQNQLEANEPAKEV